MIATRVPVFIRRAKRRMATHAKFFLFDAGVYRAIRPPVRSTARSRSTASR